MTKFETKNWFSWFKHTPCSINILTDWHSIDFETSVFDFCTFKSKKWSVINLNFCLGKFFVLSRGWRKNLPPGLQSADKRNIQKWIRIIDNSKFNFQLKILVFYLHKIAFVLKVPSWLEFRNKKSFPTEREIQLFWERKKFSFNFHLWAKIASYRYLFATSSQRLI